MELSTSMFLDRLRATAEAQPGKIAIEFRSGAGTERITYETLVERTARTAAWLAEQGVDPGDRVAICLPKTVACFQLHLAACSMGAVSLPLNPAYSAAELEYLLQDSGAKVVVGSLQPDWEETAEYLGTAVATTVIRIDPDRFGELLSRRAMDLSSVQIDPDQTALMLYTSGTTGQPKGACMSHRSLTANMDMLGEAWGWSSHDVLLHALPLFHVHGLLVALHGALHAGASSVVHSGFNADRTLHDLRSGKCNVFMGVPTMYRRLLDVAGDEHAAMRHIRLLTSGSDRLPVESFRRIEEKFGFRVVERYGMTETGIMTSNPLNGDRVAGQVGIPLPGVEMRVADPDTGLASRPGVVGEFQTRGPHVFSGYWRDPEKTARAFTDDGWFRTGDLGRCDENGRLEIKGRMKDLIISGGLNVYPSEVEQALAKHPAVEQCAVVGVPDAEWGESVSAFVVSCARGVGARELIDYCRQSLASYKTPKRVVFVESLPRNAMGKVQKAKLLFPQT